MIRTVRSVSTRRYLSSGTGISGVNATFGGRSRKLAIFGLLSSTTALTYLLYDQYERLNVIELSQDHFTPYRVTHKMDIDDSHFILELTPLIAQSTNLWEKMTSDKMWSVQIKQPQIMVVRNYTPLPLVVNRTTGNLELMRDGENTQGKLLFYIKQYRSGEVARWLHELPEGKTVELRGPYIEYELPRFADEFVRRRDFLISESTDNLGEEKFKYQPFDIAMFTAGTGIVAVLQLLLTESPFRGTVDLFHSCRDFNELGPLKSLLLKLESQKRLRLHLSESSKEPQRATRLGKLLLEAPRPYPYLGQLPFTGPTYNNIKPVLSLICGPESFITSIAGPKLSPYQGPVGGILESKGWTNDNLFKLS